MERKPIVKVETSQEIKTSAANQTTRRTTITSPNFLIGSSITTPPPAKDAHRTRQAKNCRGKHVDYHWCAEVTGGHCGGKWRRHKPSDCIPMNNRNSKNPTNNIDNTKVTLCNPRDKRHQRVRFSNARDTRQNNKRVRLAQAMAEIAPEDSDDESA